jgi:DNA repair/transcription protein MET18/MMS19
MPGIKEVLIGLHAIVKHYKLPASLALNKQQPSSSNSATITASSNDTDNISINESVQQIITSIFNYVNTQSLLQSSRKNVFEILQYFTLNYESTVKSMKHSFIDGIINAIDGEKDPRNLIITFHLAHFVLTQMSADVASSPQMLESLFDVTSCYFPITFTAPKHDTQSSITGNDLRISLRRILSCHNALADYSIPLLIDKLETATTDDVKIDTLITLSTCIGAYSIDVCIPYLPSISTALQKEVFHSRGASPNDPKEKQVYDSAITALTTLVQKIAPDSLLGFVSVHLAPHFDSTFGGWLNETATELWHSDSKLARQHASVAIHIMRSSANAYFRTWHVLWPAIRNKYYDSHAQPAQKLALLELIRDIILVGKAITHVPLSNHPLSPHHNEVIDLLFAILQTPAPEDISALQEEEDDQRIGANDSSYEDEQGYQHETPQQERQQSEIDNAADQRSIALPSLAYMATIHSNAATTGFLPPDQIQTIVRTSTTKLFADRQARVREAALDALVDVASLYTSDILESTIPQLLTDDFFSAASQGIIDEDNTVLHAVSSLATASPIILENVLPQLLNLVQSQLADAVSGKQESLQTIHAVLAALVVVVKPKLRKESDTATTAEVKQTTTTAAIPTSTSTPPMSSSSIELLSHSLIDTLKSSSIQLSSKSAEAAFDNKIVDQCRVILQYLAQAADGDVHRELLQYVFNTFAPSASIPDAMTNGVPEDQQSFAPFHRRNQQYKSQQQLIPVFSAVMSSFRPSIGLPYLSVLQETLLQYVQQPLIASSTSFNQASLLSAIQCYASTINKQNADPSLTQAVNDILINTFLRQVTDTSVDNRRRETAWMAAIWIMKALFMRAHPTSSKLANQLCSLLSVRESSATLAMLVAAGFNTVLSDSDNVLNKASHAIINPLYKQRFFAMSLPHVMKQFKELSPQSPSTPTSAAAKLKETHEMNGDSTQQQQQQQQEVLLTALANMHKHIPKSVLLANINTTLPLLVQSLNSSNADLRISTLTIITRLIREDVKTISPYLKILIPVLTQLLTYKARMTVRLSAISCLDALTQLPYNEVYPYKEYVIKALQQPLDDHKRTVRQAAVKTRGEWCVLK